MSTEKPSNAEEEYIAREEVEKRYKLAKEIAQRQKVEEAAALKAAHFMKCPKCGHDLHTIKFQNVAVDRCFSCHGTWLDEGELEKLAGETHHNSLLTSVMNIFKKQG